MKEKRERVIVDRISINKSSAEGAFPSQLYFTKLRFPWSNSSDFARPRYGLQIFIGSSIYKCSWNSIQKAFTDFRFNWTLPLFSKAFTIKSRFEKKKKCPPSFPNQLAQSNREIIVIFLPTHHLLCKLISFELDKFEVCVSPLILLVRVPTPWILIR